VRNSRSEPGARRLGSLLLDCVRGDLDRIPAAIAGCPPAALGELPSVAVFHGVEVAVRRALAGVELPDPSLHEALDQLAFEQAATSLRLRAELERLRAPLDDAGIRWAVLKGPVLADHYYRRPGRSFEDLDLLVEPGQLRRVLEVLSRTSSLLLDRNWALIRSSRRGELTLALPAGGALDLHWHVINEAALRRRFRVSTTDLLDRARPVTIGAGVVPTLDPADTLLHVAAHACLSGGYRLAWCVDVQSVAGSAEVDWSDVVRRGRRSGLALPAAVMLARTQFLLGLDLPAGVLRDLGGDTAWARGMRALTRARPLPEVRQHVLSGHTIVASTRDDSAAAAAALAREVRDHLASRLRREPTRPSNPLHHDGGEASDREAFLVAVAEEERGAYAASRAAG
jgi:Uncharacterised nucleotidyltransferase